MFLVDTSVWIEVLSKPSRLDLESRVSLEEVVVCLPVYQEVLQGCRREMEYLIAREALSAFPMVESPLRQEVFEEAVQLYRLARRTGLTIRSGVDCLIAACAIRHGLTVLHHNRDFGALARISSLQAREVG